MKKGVASVCAGKTAGFPAGDVLGPAANRQKGYCNVINLLRKVL
jgi:hypothetical protein